MKAGSLATLPKNRRRFCSITFLSNPGNLLGAVLQRAGEIKKFRARKPGQSRSHIADPVFSTLVRYLAIKKGLICSTAFGALFVTSTTPTFTFFSSLSRQIHFLQPDFSRN